MATLFGAHCSSQIFRHDAEMMLLYSARVARAKREAELDEETQERTEDDDDDDDDDEEGGGGDNSDSADANDEAPQPRLAACEDAHMRHEPRPPAPPVPAQQTGDTPSTSHPLPRCSAQDERAPPPRGGKRPRMTNQRIAYEAAKGIDLTWADYGGLECTRRAEDRDETVL
jgi:hypothetical protein